MAGLLFCKKKCKAGFEGVKRRSLLERKRTVNLSRGAEEGKSTRTNSGNPEAESIRCSAESMGGCVKLKTVT